MKHISFMVWVSKKIIKKPESKTLFIKNRASAKPTKATVVLAKNEQQNAHHDMKRFFFALMRSFVWGIPMQISKRKILNQQAVFFLKIK